MTRYNDTSNFSKAVAIQFGQLVRELIARQDSDFNVYLIAVRAFHHARIALGD